MKKIFPFVALVMTGSPPVPPRKNSLTLTILIETGGEDHFHDGNT